MPNSPYLPSPMTNCKSFLEFKSTHQMGIIFDGIRVGWIFSLLKDLFHNVQGIKWIKKGECQKSKMVISQPYDFSYDIRVSYVI